MGERKLIRGIVWWNDARRDRRISRGHPPVDVSGDTRVRSVMRADLVSVHRIERAVFTEPWSYAAFETSLSAPAFLVAQRDEPADAVAPASSDPIDGSGIVGYVVGDLAAAPETGHVKNLAVREDARGDGVGRQLLQASLRRLTSVGARSVRLEVRASNAPAVSLYRSEQFEPVRRVPNYYADGETAVVMTRQLSR